MKKLRELFEGYSQMVPTPTFLLIGNFSAESYGSGQAAALKGQLVKLTHPLPSAESFDALADLISEYGLSQR